MRVLVVDRRGLFRDGVAALVRTHIAGLDVLTAPTVAEAAPLMGRASMGLLILEAEQAVGDQLLAAVRLVHPGWRIVLLGGSSRHPPSTHVDGRLGTEADSATVIAEVRRLVGAWSERPLRAAMGDRGLPPEPAELPVAWRGAARPSDRSLPTRPLTSRQQDVLSLLAQGRSTKDIARALDLGIGTVKAHLDGLYRTLGVHSRVAAVARVQQLSQLTAASPAPDRAATVGWIPAAGGDNVIRLGPRPGVRAVPDRAQMAPAARPSALR